MDNLAKEVDLSDLPEKWSEYGTGFQRYYETHILPMYHKTYSDI